MPLIRVETFRRLIECQLDNDGPLTLLSALSDDPRGFGRIERDESNQVLGIVEEAHANERQLAITELNVGAYCFRADWVWEHLDQLPVSPKGEYYLTDLVGIAAVGGMKVMSIPVESLDESIGVNTRVHLAEAELALRKRILTHWMEAGVTVRDPSTTYVDSGVSIGQDTLLLPNTYLEGETVVGSGCTVGPNTIIRSSTIGDACTILSSVVEHATIEDEVEIGPYAHLRTGTYLEQGVHVGNFGEIKNSRLGRGVKMGHFSYIGDATIGEGVNIGAGTITCNFDGERKNKTEIGSGAFIGSDTMLVAPVRIGKGARTGAGSVVTKDVPDNSIAVGIPARVVRKRKDRD
jgi:bifunctional UDP-N-acetylglucosamine pyrophosphorylase/glucosamine-1-phosphate N-acetyltransferase